MPRKPKKRNYLLELAEKAVFIQEGEKIGKWTRENRVALVYSVLCSLIRLNKRKNKLVEKNA